LLFAAQQPTIAPGIFAFFRAREEPTGFPAGLFNTSRIQTIDR